MRIISNFKDLVQTSASEGHLLHEYLDDGKGAIEFIRKCLQSDLVILNIDQERLMLASLLRLIVPSARFRLVSVDLILRTPRTVIGCLKAFFKRICLSRVDCFILYFKNVQGYRRYYDIGPDRAVYVPFKVNGWELITARPRGTADGDYVLCAGRTLRDIETFVEAMKRAGCPGVLLQQRRELLDAHGTAAWSGELPPNLKLVVDDSDRLEDFIDFIAKARLVVIPRFKYDIAPTGISTYLVAMALNKCVIISEGPGAGDVLEDQAIIVPPEHPEKLAEEIKNLWNDEDRRARVAARGYEYAMSLGGHERLLSDILRTSIELVCAENLSHTDEVRMHSDTA
jgi:glycosyltransferase involved in cell wall biosynthesis